MKIFVKAKTRARRNAVERIDERHFAVSVKEPPVENRANFAIMELLAAHFGKTLADIRLISGCTETRKVFEVRE